MSRFQVEISRIRKVWKHPNADRLDLAKVEGLAYQFCVQKSSCNQGDEVVYFPVDSVLPGALADHLGVKNILAGSLQNRVKTVKLRGQISQGLTVPVESIRAYLEKDGKTMPMDGPALTKALSITKYEPPEISCRFGKLGRLPDGVSVFDVEGAQNFPDIVEALMDQEVCVTEKLEGTNFGVTLDRKGKFWVCQRSNSIIPYGYGFWGRMSNLLRRLLFMKPIGEHDFWKLARESNLKGLLKGLRDSPYNGQKITLIGEMVGPGIQKNIYGLTKRTVFFFDAMLDHDFLPAEKFFNLCSYVGLKTVPVLSLLRILADTEGTYQVQTLREWLAGKDLQEASNGKSKLANVKREGIVIRPMTEARDGRIGRVIIKQRSPEYLASSEL